MLERSIKSVLEYVTDPVKAERVKALTDEELAAVTTYSLRPEQGTLLAKEPLLLAIRVIYYRQIVDWASTEADRVQNTIFEFIGSESFVQYPDFLTDEKILAAARLEYMENHSVTMARLGEFELEILGARINEKGAVEVLITHNQIHPSNDGIDNYLIFPQKSLSVPPKVAIGHLKVNPTRALSGQGGEIYIALHAPDLTGYGRNSNLEIVIGGLENKTQNKDE